MAKTIAITPSWYWPKDIARLVGIPPYFLHELLVDRVANHWPDDEILVSARTRLTGAELAARVAEARHEAIAAAGEGTGVLMRVDGSTANIEAVVQLLGALSAGLHVRIWPSPATSGPTAPFEATDVSGTPPLTDRDQTFRHLFEGHADTSSQEPPLALRDPAVAICANRPAGPVTVWHSHRSLFAAALALLAYYDVRRGPAWFCAQPLSSWEGLIGVIFPLLVGTKLVLPETGESLLDPIGQQGVTHALIDLDRISACTRDAKRDVKRLRGQLGSLVLPVSGVFDVDGRRRAGRLFDCPALTLWGTAEVGPVFAAHPSWYLDESVGLPITNAHVVPVDPRSKAPVQTLWELVESALVTVRTPAAMVGYDKNDNVEDPFLDDRFITTTMGSSDANGMIYLLPD